MIQSSHAGVERITPAELQRRREAGGERIVLLDVRGREAWTTDPDSLPDAARMSLTVGDVVVVGVAGSTMRQAVALVGPSVSVGSRLLKQAPPGGIIATGEVVEALREEAPALAAEFRLLDPVFEVPGTDGLAVATWVAEPAAR